MSGRFRPMVPDVTPLSPPIRYAAAAALTVAATLLAAAVDMRVTSADQVMIYVLAAALAGLWLGRAPAALSALANIACFNWFFVEPRYTFDVADGRYVVTFVVMLVVALTIATLMANVRQRTRDAEASERRTARLYAMARELAGAVDRESIVRIAVRHVGDAFGARVTLQAAEAGAVGAATGTSPSGATRAVGAAPPPDAARPAGTVSRPVGDGATDGLTLRVEPSNPGALAAREDLALLDAFAGQLAQALERARLAEAEAAARLAAESESIRSTLLASISHDLRTPLAVITAAGTALAEPGLPLDAAERAELARSIAAKALDVSNLVSNVLDLLRLEGGPVPLRRDWEGLDDLVGLALNRTHEALAGRTVETRLDPALPLVNVDAALMVQLLGNLLENAARHTPPGATVRIHASVEGARARIVVEDDGPGLPPGSPERLFTKFTRGADAALAETAGDAGGERRGAGLGLAICRAIATAHGGTIVAEHREPHGARFVVTLPTGGPSS
jgi:two-component system sensor histidine kinase KdpD